MKRSLVFAALLALSTAATAAAPVTQTSADAYGNTALMAAAASGDTATVKYLLGAGAQINARSHNGNTALIYAAQEGHERVVQLLVEAGADIQARNYYDATAAKLALGHGHIRIADQLQAVTATPQTTTAKDLI